MLLSTLLSTNSFLFTFSSPQSPTCTLFLPLHSLPLYIHILSPLSNLQSPFSTFLSTFHPLSKQFLSNLSPIPLISEPDVAIEVSVKSEIVQGDAKGGSCSNIETSETQSKEQTGNDKCQSILSQFSEEMNDLIENLSNPTASIEDNKRWLPIHFFFWLFYDISAVNSFICICICYTCTQALTVILKGLLKDSRSFNKDPPHLTLNYGFWVIQLSRRKKIA